MNLQRTVVEILFEYLLLLPLYIWTVMNSGAVLYILMFAVDGFRFKMLYRQQISSLYYKAQQ